MMIRFFDIVFALTGIILAWPFLLVLLVIGYFDTGSPIFIQKRVGYKRKAFNLIKLRSMKTNTASVASHLVDASTITPFGHFLRKSKLDELPQLWNVLNGDMSLVGPRPCLDNQLELIKEREQRGVFLVKPGITGLAQIKEIDMSTPVLLAETDLEMIQGLNLKKYFLYIFYTAMGKGSGDRVRPN